MATRDRFKETVRMHYQKKMAEMKPSARRAKRNLDVLVRYYEKNPKQPHIHTAGSELENEASL
jgi:hypothetical protein